MKKQSNTVRPKAITREGSIFEGVSCYVLDNGKRVITKRSMVSALSGTVKGEDANIARYIEHLPNGSVLLSSTENVEFQLPTNATAHGIEAETVAKMLKLYAVAWGAGALRANQIQVAQRAVTMLAQFAEIGIVALVDEATGYQKKRGNTDLQDRLMAMIKSELDDIDPVYKPLLVALARLPGTTHCDYYGEGIPPAWGPLVANICVTCRWGERGRLKLRDVNPKPTWTHRDTQHLDAEGKKVLNRVIGIGMAFAHTAKDFTHWRNQMESYFKGTPLQGWLF
jgi:hypothetical protein